MATASDSVEPVLHRKLGLHERFSVARHNVGAPPVLAYGARLDWSTPGRDGDLDYVRSHLSRRIDKALQALPLLSCYIEGSMTREPRFASSRQVSAKDVMLPLSKTKAKGDPSLESLLEEAVDQPAPAVLDLTTAPLWQVRLHETSNGAIVLLIVHHVICDGRGTANLLELLLSGLDMSTTCGLVPASAAFQQCGIPSTSDHLVKPSLRYTLGAVWKELLAPRLPSFVRSYVQAQTAWPQASGPVNEAEVMLAPPLKARKTVKLLSFPPGTLAALKQSARTEGVKTVQPVLNTVCAVAAYAVARRRGEAASEESVRVSSTTAMSVRGMIKDEREHTGCTGNFVGSIPWQSAVSPQDDFWAMTRSYADLISSDYGRAQGRYGVGVLAYLPDPPPSSNTPASAESPTGWEAWLREKAGSAQPFNVSFDISNLGRITFPTRSAVVEVAWALRPPVIGPLFEVDVCGLSGSTEGTMEQLRPASDLTMCIGWNRGVLSEDGSREQAFVDTVKKCIELLTVKAEGGERSKLTVGALLDGATG